MPDIQIPAWRDKQRIGALMNRLNKHANGELEKPMTATEIRAAEIILKKTVPDLSSVTLSGDPDKPVKVDAKIEIVHVAAKHEG